MLAVLLQQNSANIYAAYQLLCFESLIKGLFILYVSIINTEQIYSYIQ